MEVNEGPPDGNGRTPAQVVRAYLALRRTWDLSTAERVTVWKRGNSIDSERPFEIDSRALEAAWIELASIRQKWCTPAAYARLDPRESFGSSSDFNPDDVAILSLREASSDIVELRTQEYPYASDDPRLAVEYDYVLERMDGEWRLDGRASVGYGGEVLRDLL